MEIQRQFYLDELIRKQGNGFVKVITGLRRCGKSYLLRTIFKNHLLANGIAPEEIVEMAFDERDNKKFRDPDLFYEFAKEKLAQQLNRFNPDLIADGQNPLTMDSNVNPNASLEDFLKTESRFAAARSVNPQFNKLIDLAKANNAYKGELKKHIAQFVMQTKPVVKENGEG